MRVSSPRFILCAVLAAPGGFGCDGKEITSFHNEGRVCLLPADRERSDASIDGQGVHEVSVLFDSCASGCARVTRASCQATVEDDTIHLTSHAELRVPAGSDNCPDECVRVEAICAIERLPAGPYTIEHGQLRIDVEVPSAQPCE
jgi:hypothetical protein